MEQTGTLYIVVPCYNEEEVLPETSKRLKAKLEALEQAGHISAASRVMFVDDGSRDRTWNLIAELCAGESCFSGVRLSRNRGHQNALLAGLTAAVERADVVISMDADLQDDIDAVDAMLEKYRQGCQVVYGVRSDRTTDSSFKRGTAQLFYKLMKSMGVETVYNHADYRLMGKRALEELLSFKEVNLFLRGMVPLVGFKSDVVAYKRGERFAGESKYPLKKMLAFAIDGVTSFSVKPLQLILMLGVLLGMGGGIALLVQLILVLMGQGPSTAAWLLSCVWLIAGIQLAALGVVGEYIGKIYMEAKGRPSFIIEQVIDR